MADQPPEVQCPSCGSPDVAPVFLSLIQARYFECRGCKVTFRQTPVAPLAPDLDRFNDGWRLPPEKPKK